MHYFIISPQVELRTFTGSAIEGRQGRLHQLTLARMNAGDASITAEGNGEVGFNIEGRLNNVGSGRSMVLTLVSIIYFLRVITTINYCILFPKVACCEDIDDF